MAVEDKNIDDSNIWLHIYSSLDNLITSENSSLSVDANCSSKLGDLQEHLTEAQKKQLDADQEAVQHADADPDKGILSKAQSKMQQDSADWNLKQTKASNMLEASTSDISTKQGDISNLVTFGGTINQTASMLVNLSQNAFVS
jgi:hypothetical protein